MKHSFFKVAALMMVSVMTLSACSPPNAADSQSTTPAAVKESSEAGESTAEGTGEEKTDGAVTITMAMTAPWDTFIPFNTTNGNTDAVLELMYDKLIVVKANRSKS